MVFESTPITSGLSALEVPKIWRLKAASLTVLLGEVTVAGVIVGVAAGCLSACLGFYQVQRNYWMCRGSRRESCLLYTSDAADDLLCVDLGGSRLIKKKNIT